MTVASGAAASRHLRCGSAATIGWRPYMEDELVAAPEWLPARRLGLLAVFDGHGGAEAARFCAHHVVGGLVVSWL
jgi:serine/threonine protein phosphatase PrpC